MRRMRQMSGDAARALRPGPTDALNLWTGDSRSNADIANGNAPSLERIPGRSLAVSSARKARRRPASNDVQRG